MMQFHWEFNCLQPLSMGWRIFPRQLGRRVRIRPSRLKKAISLLVCVSEWCHTFVNDVSVAEEIFKIRPSLHFCSTTYPKISSKMIRRSPFTMHDCMTTRLSIPRNLPRTSVLYIKEDMQARFLFVNGRYVLSWLELTWGHFWYNFLVPPLLSRRLIPSLVPCVLSFLPRSCYGLNSPLIFSICWWATNCWGKVGRNPPCVTPVFVILCTTPHSKIDHKNSASVVEKATGYQVK